MIDSNKSSTSNLWAGSHLVVGGTGAGGSRVYHFSRETDVEGLPARRTKISRSLVVVVPDPDFGKERKRLEPGQWRGWALPFSRDNANDVFETRLAERGV